MQADMTIFGSPQLAETATTKQSTSGSVVRGVTRLQAYRHRFCFPYQYVFISLCIV
jgi:hypothetical protein